MLRYRYTFTADECSRIHGSGFVMSARHIETWAPDFQSADAAFLAFIKSECPKAGLVALDGLTVVL